MFTVAAIALVTLLGIAAAAACVGPTPSRVAAIQTTSVLTVLVMLLLWRVLGDDGILHVAMALAVLSVAGSLLFARFLEHWL